MPKPSKASSSPRPKRARAGRRRSSGRSASETFTVGSYRVRGKLGEGYSGSVRLGVHNITGQRVALKFVAKTTLEPRQQERLTREARLLTLLHHPNIVQLSEVLDTPDAVVFVMEYVPKGELLKYITDHGFLHEHKFRPMFRAIVSAVDYCHRNSVVHRDLKPENILLDDNKEPKIIDFGLSNLYDSTRLLETFCGSPKYAAPEIVTGTKYVGPTVDVWSLGVILYASLSGKLPFMGSTVEKMYKRILEGKVNYPTHFSPEVRDLIGKILKVKGEERLSMEEIMAHPWMNKGYDAPVSNYLPHRPSVVAEANEDVLEQTVAFGYARLEVLEAIVLEGYNSIKSTYFLVAERKERLDQLKRERMQVADKNWHTLEKRASGMFKKLIGSLRSTRLTTSHLDLAYVVPDRLISMGFPATGVVDKLLSNPIHDVFTYFEKTHKDHYKIFNLVPGNTGGYDPRTLGGHVVRFPVHGLGPTFQTIVDFCKALDEWLHSEKENVAAIHGRPGDQDNEQSMIMICAYLVHSKTVASTDEALNLYNSRLFGEQSAQQQSVRPSTRRYVRYYEEYVKSGMAMPLPKLYALTVMVFEPIPEFDVYGGCDPFVRVWMNGLRIMQTTPNGHYSVGKGDTQIVIECKTVPLTDDVYVRVLDKERLSNEEMFSFKINTRFLLHGCHATEELDKDFMVPPPLVHSSRAPPSEDSSATPHAHQGHQHSDRHLFSSVITFAQRLGILSPAMQAASSSGSGGGGDTNVSAVGGGDDEGNVADAEEDDEDDGDDGEEDEEEDDDQQDDDYNNNDDDEEGDDSDEKLSEARAKASVLSSTAPLSPSHALSDDELHPLERTHFSDHEEEEAPAQPKGRNMRIPRLIFFQRSPSKELATTSPPPVPGTLAVPMTPPRTTSPRPTSPSPPHPQTAHSMSNSSSSINLLLQPSDPYIASRIRVTLTKADLDIPKPDRFPDDFRIELLMKEPRVRKYTAEDFEANPPLVPSPY